MKILRRLRNTYSGEEFLVVEGNEYLRMKVMSHSPGSHYADFVTRLQKLREFNLRDLILPKRVEFSDVIKIYYPFRAEAPVAPQHLESGEKKYLAAKLLELAHLLSHMDIPAFATFGFDDILELDDFFFLLPVWFKPEALSENAFVDPYFLKTGKMHITSSIYVLGKTMEELLKSEIPDALKTLVTSLTAEDPSSRPSHVSLPGCVEEWKSRGIRREYVQLTLPPVGRDELLHLVREKIEELDAGFHVFHIFGEHGVGKSTFLEMIQHELRESGYSVIVARDIKRLIESLVQIGAEKLDNLSPETQRVLMDYVSSGTLNDAVKLAVKILLQGFDNLFILIDDYDAIDPDLKLFLKDISFAQYEGRIVEILVTHSAEGLDVSASISLNIPPLGQEEIGRLLRFVFEDLPEDTRQQITRWLHSLSEGIPGLAVEILRTLYPQLRKNPEEFEPQKLKGFDYLIEARLKSVPKEYIWTWSRLALLGTRFSEDEINALVKVLDVPVHSLRNALEKLMKYGFLYKESDEIYKFNLHEFWEIFAKQVEEAEAKKIYERLYRMVDDPWLKAWYLERLGKLRSAAALCIKEAIKALDDGNYLRAKMFLEEAKSFLKQGETSYALGTRFAWLLSEIEERQEDAEKLLDEHVTITHLKDFYRLSIALNSENLEEARKLALRMDERLRDFPPYLRLRVLTLLLKFANLKGERPEELVNLSRQELERFTPLNCKHHVVYAEFQGELALLELSVSSHVGTSTMEKLQNAMETLEKHRAWVELIKLQSAVANRFLPVLPALGQHLLESASSKSKELGIHNKLINLKLELLVNSLYKGQKREFLRELQEIRSVATASGNLYGITRTYFIEGMFHAYNKEYEDAEEDLKRELQIEEASGFRKRALRAMATLYAMKGDLERSRELLLENIDDPAISHTSFLPFAHLILAKSDEDFKKAWKELIEKTVFWREESILIFSERMIRLNRDFFLKIAFESEESNALADMLLSLALIYEGLGKAFWADGENLKARRFLRRAYEIYESIGFDNAADALESYPVFAGSKKLYENRQDWYRTQNLMKNEALMTIRFANNIASTKELLEYLSNRLGNLIPAENISMVLRRHSQPLVQYGEIPENLLSQDFIKDISGSQPLKILQSMRIDSEHDLVVLIENPHLFLDDQTFEYYLEFLNQMEIALIGTIRFSMAQETSITDPLTGLYTRWYFTKRLEEEFERYRRYGIPFSVIMADIDDFKQINDTYGHPKGDEVLKFIAAIMTSSVRATDIVGRYGGEEFILILTNTVKSKAIEVAEKLRSTIKSRNPFPFPITISLGVSGLPDDRPERAADLVSLADKALYVSKNSGKDRVSYA